MIICPKKYKKRDIRKTRVYAIIKKMKKIKKEEYV